MNRPVADGAVDEPAQRAGSKLPGRAIFSAELWTLFDIPAIGIQLATRLQARQQKKKLPFDGGRHERRVGKIDALDALRQLVGASLVQTRSGDTTRYRLLETTRLFARERLRASDSWQDVFDRHDAHFSERCRELRPAFFGSGRPEACRAIEAEFPDHVVIPSIMGATQEDWQTLAARTADYAELNH